MYIDIDGKWKLELDGPSFGGETNVDEDKDENKDQTEFEIEETRDVKWCQPVSVISDDSSSSEDERVKLCYPVHGEGHKFSDGIVWETIEEEEEEEEEVEEDGESKNNEVKMNVVGNMKNDSDEFHVMLRGDTPGKKEVHHQSHKPFITEQTLVIKPDRGSVGCGSVGDMDNTDEEPEQRSEREQEEEEEKDIEEEEMEEAEGEGEGGLGVADEVDDLEDSDDFQYELKNEEKEYPVTKEELGNISVKNLAKFWEEVSKKVRDEAEKTEPVIQKKWNSMPNLKEKYEKRRLPALPGSAEPELPTVTTNVVKSDEIIDDVDLCRSVSLRDRKVMFEMLSKQTKKERAKQWSSSMPSLKQERKLPDLPSTGKSRVRWEDEEQEDWRGRSPVRELMKSFEVLPQQSPGYQRSPASPQTRTNEIFEYKDENYSSSDSISSSMTCSSLSTVITRSARPASLLEDSGGEIYTDSDQNTQRDDHRLYLVENGLEYSLSSLDSRKSKFENLHTVNIKPNFIPARLPPRLISTCPNLEPQSTERVKSSSVPYREEEKDILQNINIVKSLKSKFLK